MPALHELKMKKTDDEPGAARPPLWRIGALCLFFLVSVIAYMLLIGTAPRGDGPVVPFLSAWMVSFVPYLACCAFVLVTKPAQGRWHWIEVGIILLGAFVLRAMLLPLPPVTSRDSWRYLWDARVTLHGFSPYVYAPADRALAPLRDMVLYPNSRFRTVPTIYPPGAQGVFLLSYVLAGANLLFLKAIFLAFDMVTCVSLVVLLERKGLDPRRAIIYAWCPLPIVEFAIQGHVDVITLTFTILAVLSAAGTSIRGRMLTGFLIGLATLSKLYPILLLFALLSDITGSERNVKEVSILGGDCREGADKSAMGAINRPLHIFRHDFMKVHHRPLRFTRKDREPVKDRGVALVRSIIAWSVPQIATCCGTILLGYLPYLILGHGQVLGYFAIYAGEQGENAGPVQQVVYWLAGQFHMTLGATITLEHIIDIALISVASLLIIVLRLRNHISREAATLVLFGVVLSISSHVFPWYTTVLLLWVPVLISPDDWKGRSARSLAITAVWYFTIASLLGYFVNQVSLDWGAYYRLVYMPAMIALGGAAIIGGLNLYRNQKGGSPSFRVRCRARFIAASPDLSAHSRRSP